MERLERGRRIVREALLPTAREERAPWAGPGGPQAGMGGEHACRRGQGHSVLARLRAGREDVSRAHVGGPGQSAPGWRAGCVGRLAGAARG